MASTYGTGLYGDGTYSADAGGESVTSTAIQERPPLRISLDIETSYGRHHRWATDEPDAANIPSGVRWSDTMPGGFESFDAVLPRKAGRDYPDLERGSTIRVRSASGGITGEYRLERTPRSSGDRMSVTPSAVGYQAALEDNKAVQEIYVDREIGGWQEAPLVRQEAIAAVPDDQARFQTSANDDGLVWQIPNEAITGNTSRELHYQAPTGVLVASVGYKGTRTGAFTSFEAPTLYYAPDQAFAGFASSAITLDDTIRSVTLSTARRYLMLRARIAGGFPQTPAVGHLQRVSKVAVYGDHGVTIRTISGEPGGVIASDVITHAVTEWVPTLRIDNSVTPSSFVIPHLVFREATTVAEIIRQATRYGLEDWAVWANQVFWWHPRGARGKAWRARVANAHLEETGPQMDRVWESVIVEYQDPAGPRTVGPPGSGADTEDASLKDTDPENPANKLGIIRRDRISMGISTAAGAIEIGRRFLEEQKVLDSSGRAELVGHVEDDRGVLHPYHAVHAGDTITFVDAADTSPRRIVRADKSHDSRSCSVDLDAPPEGLQALLERLGVVLVGM